MDTYGAWLVICGEFGAPAVLTLNLLGSLASPSITALRLSSAEPLCLQEDSELCRGQGSPEFSLGLAQSLTTVKGSWARGLPYPQPRLARERGQAFWEKQRFLLDCPAQFTKEGKKQKFHLGVPSGTGDSSCQKLLLEWIFQKLEHVGRWQEGCGGRKETLTSLTKRVPIFPMRWVRTEGRYRERYRAH